MKPNIHICNEPISDYTIICDEQFGWTLFINDEYNFSVKFCPNCGEKLK